MNLELFNRWLKLNYNSEATINNYIWQLKQFFNFSQGEFNQITIDNYLVKKKEGNVSKNTFCAILTSLKVYSQFAKIDIQLPKYQRADKRLKEYITEEQLKEILRYTPMLFKNYKEYDLILQMFFYTGMRKKEIYNFEVSDILWDKKRFRIKNTKTGKDRAVPFFNNTKLLNNLKDHIKGLKNNKLFVLTSDQIEYMFDKIRTELSLEKFHPHLLRVSFAKHCVKNKIDAFTLSLYLGHSDIKTTQIYAEPDEQMAIDIGNNITFNKG